ncbi:MAG: hypothetical protein KJZ91_23930 [Myxococcales bacterium]|nr:hypothetical protein [Myxococcales bacterium]
MNAHTFPSVPSRLPKSTDRAVGSITMSRCLTLLALAALSACQWEVPGGPPDSGDDAAETDAATDGPQDAATDGPPMVTLTVVRTGTSTGSVASNTVGASMIDCGTTCSAAFPPGTLVTLTATPGASALFSGWSGVCNDTAPNCSFTLDSDTTIQATFDLRRHTVTVVPGGNGVGSVTSNVGGISCPGTCQASLDHGTALTLTATPTPPSVFAGWNDAGCTGTSPCSFTVTQAEVIDAPFALDYTLTVARNGNGSGTVISTPAGINCGTDCDQVYSAGTMVTLTATPAADSVFAGWSGACTGTTSCAVTINAVVAVTATFNLRRHTLTAARTGTGGGVVTSNPAGINCGTDCDEPYDHGTDVTLTATADGTSTFTGWSGSGCSGTGACVVAMTAARTVSAAFTRNQYLLTVTRAGSGSSLGTVTSSPGGVACGADCDHLYDAGTMVTLTASTSGGVVFAGWSGSGCAGMGSCTVTMSAARSVTATFLQRYTLAVSRAGLGTGTVTSTSPAGAIDCGTDCSELVTDGTIVTLAAAPTGGSVFHGWSGGGCSGTGTCTTTVTAAVTVTATFDRCARSTQTCSVGRFTQCDATGDFVSYAIPNGSASGGPVTITMNDYQCPMGCHAAQPRCADIDASNGLNAALDAPQTSPAGVDVSLPVNPAIAGNVIIDTSNYNSTSGTTQIVDPDGSLLTVPAQVITQTDAPEILVLKVRTFKLLAGRNVEVRGTRALAIASHFDIYLAGSIDLSPVAGESLNPPSRPGPGHSVRSSCEGQSTGNGAFGGGGNAFAGGRGSIAAATGGMPISSVGLSPLEGGGGGGYQNNGGGAIQLVSRTRVAMASTSLLNVSGGAGELIIFFGWFGTGGGAGGGVLIEAPSTQFTAGAVIAGRGGSGGASDSNTVRLAGVEGPVAGTTPAPAVTCTGCGTSGAGGTESASAGNAVLVNPNPIASGGGSVGRCVVRNAAGAVTPPSGMMKLSFQTPLTLPARSP